jgi:hypothetical protein
MKKIVRLKESDLQIIVKKVLVESKVDKSIDNILNNLIMDTEFGWGGMGLTPYIIFPWDPAKNRTFIHKKNHTEQESPQLEGGYLRRDYGGPFYESEINEMYGLSKDVSDILWGKYSTITIKMITDFLDIYGDNSKAVFGDGGNTIIDSVADEVKYFTHNYIGSSDVPIEVYDDQEVVTPNEEDDTDVIDVEELYDSLGTILRLSTTMCNDHYDDDPIDIMDPEEALECLYDIGTDRSHRLIEMIEYYMNQIDYQESNGIG